MKSKNLSFKINISSTFLVRSKCKFCLSGPVSFYFSIMPPKLLQPIPFNNGYLPSRATHLIYNHGYSPKIHMSRNTIPDDISEMVCCKCHETRWKINFLSHKSLRPEILHRKGKFNYPSNIK